MKIEEITFEELLHLKKYEPVTLIDVRTREEYEKEHLEGAENICKEDIKLWKKKIIRFMTVYIT